MASIFLSAREAVWYVKFRTADGWKRAKLGRHPSPFPPSRPPKKCPDALAKKAEEYIERDRLFREGREPTGKTPLAGYFAEHMATITALKSPGTVRNRKRVGRGFVEFCKSREVEFVQGVDRKLCREWMESRLATIAASTVGSERGIVSAILGRAEEDGVIPSNPMRGLKLPKKPTPSDPVFWTSEEVGRIVNALPKEWQRDLVLFLANTGIRVVAAISTRWDWIDRERGIIRIPPTSDRKGKGYETPINRVTAKVLERRQDARQGPQVFARASGKAIGYGSIYSAFRKAVAASGVRPGTIHDLRHTYARSLCDAGVPLNSVQAALGHSSLTMTQRYASVSGRHAVQWMDNFAIGEKPKDE